MAQLQSNIVVSNPRLVYVLSIPLLVGWLGLRLLYCILEFLP